MNSAGSRIAVTLACAALAALPPAASAQAFPLPAPQDAVIGRVETVSARHEDTLSELARTHQLGYEQIVAANPGVDPWLPGAGTRIVLPTQHVLPDTPRRGLVLNLPEFRLYYFPPPQRGQTAQVVTYPASIGHVDWKTPLGVTRVVAKAKDPTWYPPASIRAEHARNGDPLPAAVPPGPDNPLGAFALRLALPGYLIHGTNRPYGIGMRVTHGCVRLYPEHIAELYRAVPVGTPLRVVDQPVKAGWREGVLHLQVHAPLAESGARADVTAAVRAVIAATRDRPADVDWDAVAEAARQRRGVPVAVTR
ncbi:MAG TPA: L,D-transpeptidase family protein [Burkholderiaceae bacterium]|nr:L,D-transpeptidase family protein [Burkholderiaceae bacterium]